MKIEFAQTDYGQEEKDAANKVWDSELLASGPENEAFESEFAEYVGAKYAVCVNSGSSANLLALASLDLPKDSPVLTSACGFPATLNPILHLSLKPLLVDYSSVTNNINIPYLVEASKRSKAVIFAHTMGNIVEFPKLSVPVIEDCCEAVGSKHVGKMGTLATWSFYPAHQMTAGGSGGMVTTNYEELYKRMKSMRDWGKQYSWDSGRGGNQTIYDSEIGYHAGYTYTTLGWNFKLPEVCAAFGRVQIKKLDKFKEIRMSNWKYLYKNLKKIRQMQIPLMHPEASPFGFCMNLTNGRNEFGMYLESKGIKHRPFFAGNLLRQPAYLSPESYKYPVADWLMNHSLFIGCHTKLTQEDLDYMVETIRDYYSYSEL